MKNDGVRRAVASSPSQHNLETSFARVEGARPASDGGSAFVTQRVEIIMSLDLEYKQGFAGEWPQAKHWAFCQLTVLIDARYQAGSQPILDLPPLAFAVPRQWFLAPSFVPCAEMSICLEEVARATLEALDSRWN